MMKVNYSLRVKMAMAETAPEKQESLWPLASDQNTIYPPHPNYFTYVKINTMFVKSEQTFMLFVYKNNS